MALEKQTVNFPLVKGINDKVDDKQEDIGDMGLLENAIFKTVKKFRKRNGYGALSTNVLTPIQTFTFQKLSSTITAGSWAASYKNQIVVGDGFGLYSYSDSDSKWVYRGRCESARVELKDVYKISNAFPSGFTGLSGAISTIYHPDSAYNSTSGYQLFAWESYSVPPLEPTYLGSTSVGVQYALFDYETGAQLFNGFLANTTSRPKCISISSSLYLFYYDSNDQKVKARLVSSSGVGAETDIVTNIDTTTPNYDLLVNNSLIYIGYNGAGSTVKIASFNSSLVNQASVSKSETAGNGIGIFADTSNNIWCAYSNGTDVKAFIMDSTLVTTVLAPQAVSSADGSNTLNVTGVYDGTQGIIFYDRPGVREEGQYTGVQFTVNYTQPAVGSSVAITVGGSLVEYVGQVLFINTGGYYYISSATATTITAINLGGPSNAAPAATVTASQNIYPAHGHINATIRMNTLTVGGTAGTATNFSPGMTLASKAFLKGSVAHVFGSFDSLIQPTNFLCALYDVNASALNTPIAHIVGRVASNFAGGMAYKGILPSVNNISGSIYQIPTTVRVLNVTKTVDNTAYSNFFNGVSSAEIDLSPTQVSKVEIADNLHVASGSLMMYDGQNVVESGFHCFPEVVTAVDNGTGRIADGTYSYKVVYSWIDAQGQIHRSAPSTVVSVTTSGGNSKVDVSISALYITQKNDVSIEIYRTTASGSVYYRIDTNYLGTSSYPVRNLTTNIGTPIEFDDVFSDDEISGNQQLYTTGEIENIIAPAPRSLSTFKNRLMLVPADDPTTEWYSKQVIPGSPVEMTDSFVQNTEQTGGSVIGTVQLDDKEILFKGENIYYVVGSGPAASGANNDFSDPTLIATDVGLVDRASIVAMPFGVMFKSDKGIYLLDRSLSVQYIGAMVESYNQYTVLAARLVADANQIRFFLSNGQAIVYDYFVQQWSVFTNHAAVDSLVSQSTFYYLKSNGTVMMETADLFSDNGDFIVMKLSTGWLSFAGVQGLQRVWQMLLLGDYISAHNLKVDVAYDFDDTVAQTKTFSPTADPYQYRVNFDQQKCQALKVTIQDVDTGTDGESYSLSNLAFVVGIKKGLNKFTSTRSG